ncbi:MAG: type IV pilus biogenesis/stability protein PilW [Gammaproteobacteria bacterium]
MLRRWVLVLVAAATVAGCTSTTEAPEVSDKDAARFNVQLGMNYMQRGDLEGAREKLERAVKQDPTLPAAHSALGILYERAGDIPRAQEHLRRATRLAPDDPNMMNNYGGFLCRKGEYEEGIRHFEMAAANAYYRAPETALSNAGVCARRIPDPERAEEYFRLALDKNRNFTEALLQLADLSLETNRELQARAFLQRYEALSPITAYSLELGWRIEQAAGDTRAAAEYAKRLRQEFPDSREVRSLGRE